ncbi:MAG: hypothetical protein BGO98_41665 [Myxococcales bacterium 68-20]|nr:hypothetical protein [Myxococcales bacterium]OJY27767.1 MAG: hypothetical protein BGO98_41665 [Myxococcales bacterium 68-20]
MSAPRSENELRIHAAVDCPSKKPVTAMRGIVAASGLFGLLVFATAVASCAESESAVAPQEPPTTVPEAGSPQTDAAADASADADCLDAGDGGCTTNELTCAEADFCAVPTGVDLRYALFGVWGSSDKDVWAVGSAGTVIHWDGTAWTGVPLGRKETMRGVGGRSANDVFVVSSLDVVLHSDGFKNGSATFTAEPTLDPIDPTNFMGATLTKVWAANTGELFVGGPATAGWSPPNSLWRHHPGADEYSTWEAASTYCAEDPCLSANDIWGTSASDIWVVGQSGGLRRSKGPVGNGGGPEQWTNVKTTVTTANLNGIWGSSASDVWIVGDGGTIRHWSNDGTERWEIVPSPTKENLRAVWGTSPTDAWAVGDAGTILHWDGKTWSFATATLPVGPKPRLYGIWGSGPNDVWVVGEAIALHFTGPKSSGAPRTRGEADKAN